MKCYTPVVAIETVIFNVVGGGGQSLMSAGVINCHLAAAAAAASECVQLVCTKTVSLSSAVELLINYLHALLIAAVSRSARRQSRR